MTSATVPGGAPAAWGFVFGLTSPLESGLAGRTAGPTSLDEYSIGFHPASAEVYALKEDRHDTDSGKVHC